MAAQYVKPMRNSQDISSISAFGEGVEDRMIVLLQEKKIYA